MKRSLFLLAAFAASLLTANATTYTVTSLADTPARGTLRWAIGKSNADAGSTIAFDASGTIALTSPLPALASRVTIDGATAPGFRKSPVVAINFTGGAGLTVAEGADGTVIRALSLIRARDAAVTIQASRVTVTDNYIGLDPSGSAAPNLGDGIRIASGSQGNLIGGFDPVTNIRYFDTSNPAAFKIQPVTAWQGIRNHGDSTRDLLICGTSDDDGLLYIGPLTGGGKSYTVIYPHAATTSVYGPDNLKNGVLRLVGSYTKQNDQRVYNHGFVWEGHPNQLPGGGVFRTIDYPGAKYQFTHSTMGGLAVGNADRPTKSGQPLGPGVAYIYDVERGKFVTNIKYPGAKTTTAYGIWYNGGTSYTICGGYSVLATNNLDDQSVPLARGRAYLVDYDSQTGEFSHWASYRYHNSKSSRDFVTHFEGISSTEPGVYTLSADSVKRGSKRATQGSWVSVRRNANGTFSGAEWVDLNYPGERAGISSSNSVYGTQVVGLVIGSSPFAFQANVQIGFQLSNVISGNKGNGVGIYGSSNNIVAQNYIGTNPDGTRAIGNDGNGVLLTSRASNNLIGGQEAGANNPTGSEGKTKPVFVVPAQGNLISGNGRNGVLIARGSKNNTLSGNFIGTNARGNKALGNRLDGVGIDHSRGNALIGCTLHQNPFVFYNVVSGNGRDGVRLRSADNVTIRANFLGIGANNSTLVPNRGDGLNVTGSSRNTQVGGVIPLGNVISGNSGNGIAVRDRATNFISFNTFGGGFAFGGAAPNGRNGILVTSTGGRNVIRTCILSGNKGNGVEIGGDASGVQITDTACGTDTAINAPLPNQGNGVLISGTAHQNVLGGAQPSIEGRTHFSGNLGYGVAIVGGAHDNFIYNSNVGLGHAQPGFTDPTIPNQSGGVYLGEGTSATTIGGSGLFKNYIDTNVGPGLAIMTSTLNSVVGNDIDNNTTYGVFATGACDGTAITGNTITGNGTADVEISSATGITYTP